jgi:hypothetical protein
MFSSIIYVLQLVFSVGFINVFRFIARIIGLKAWTFFYLRLCHSTCFAFNYSYNHILSSQVSEQAYIFSSNQRPTSRN